MGRLFGASSLSDSLLFEMGPNRVLGSRLSHEVATVASPGPLHRLGWHICRTQTLCPDSLFCSCCTLLSRAQQVKQAKAESEASEQRVKNLQSELAGIHAEKPLSEVTVCPAPPYPPHVLQSYCSRDFPCSVKYLYGLLWLG